MQFEKQDSFVKKVGEKLGLLLGVFVFVFIAFFVAGKAGFLCWSKNNFFYFAGSLLAVYIFIMILRRFGNNGNKIVY